MACMPIFEFAHYAAMYPYTHMVPGIDSKISHSWHEGVSMDVREADTPRHKLHEIAINLGNENWHNSGTRLFMARHYNEYMTNTTF
jgi:hypothetical protein